MKRSEIYQEIREAEQFFAALGFRLPQFASWSPKEFRAHGEELREICDCHLGWDVTDFGHGAFRREGLLLFTIRNGICDSVLYIPMPTLKKL